ncbi:hypothetical protein NE237_009456 [Protea cynaroides]|uniref:Uncharacterized protein n=1 Tax=Protea cynaroides TaxID=273540 RepID=A0A9Q0KYD8_9MAGN|nr:hypothetical protein NE237_009456 [Protea cynaroides]
MGDAIDVERQKQYEPTPEQSNALSQLPLARFLPFRFEERISPFGRVEGMYNGYRSNRKLQNKKLLPELRSDLGKRNTRDDQNAMSQKGLDPLEKRLKSDLLTAVSKPPRVEMPAVRRTQGLGLLCGLRMHFPIEWNPAQLSSAEPKGKNHWRRMVEYSQEAFLSVEVCK